MVSLCLPSDALLQHLPSYLGFSYLGSGISLHGHSSKAQPLLLTLDEGYLLTAAPPDLEHRIAPLGPPVPMQPLLLGCGVAPPSCRPWPQAWSSREITLPTKVCLVKAMAFPLVMFQEPAQEIPPMTRSCGEAWRARRVRSQGVLCLSIYPETKICLFTVCYTTLLT